MLLFWYPSPDGRILTENITLTTTTLTKINLGSPSPSPTIKNTDGPNTLDSPLVSYGRKNHIYIT